MQRSTHGSRQKYFILEFLCPNTLYRSALTLCMAPLPGLGPGRCVLWRLLVCLVQKGRQGTRQESTIMTLLFGWSLYHVHAPMIVFYVVFLSVLWRKKADREQSSSTLNCSPVPKHTAVFSTQLIEWCHFWVWPWRLCSKASFGYLVHKSRQRPIRHSFIMTFHCQTYGRYQYPLFVGTLSRLGPWILCFLASSWLSCAEKLQGARLQSFFKYFI